VFLVSNGLIYLAVSIRLESVKVLTRTLGLGKYIVPEWVGAQPFDSDVQAIYASEGALPMILPLKPEKVELAVKVAT